MAAQGNIAERMRVRDRVRTGLDPALRRAAAPARWNHNLHYHSVILDAIPPGCRRALDVGCGEGTLTRELRRRVPAVIGIDRDHASIAAARAHNVGGARAIGMPAILFRDNAQATAELEALLSARSGPPPDRRAGPGELGARG